MQTFNNPLTTFKTETFIVLMTIAWTYLLHAHYRGQGVEYRYYKQHGKRRKFDRLESGAFRYWELSRCLNESACPLDGQTKNNLRFLIGLRNEIEHHHSAGVDEAFTARYVACCLNYDREITRLFGPRYSIASHMTYVLHLRDLISPVPEQDRSRPLPANVQSYISSFDGELTLEDYRHPHFSYRLSFDRRLVNNRGKSDRVIEFIGSDSELAEDVDKEYWVTREVERTKYRPSDILEVMREEGYAGFKMHHHTELWKVTDAKNPGKGYGARVSKVWYWYERWVDEVRKHCAANKSLYSVDSRRK